MTNGKTTFKIDHNVPSAVQAAIDTLALAVAWSEGTSDHDKLLEIKKRLQAVEKTMRPPGAGVGFPDR